jgi:RHS repeat-associated protein
VSYETDGSGNMLRSYTYSPTGLPQTMTTWSGGTGTTYFYHESPRGDVIALTDGSGNTVAQYSYDSWGNILSSTGSMANVNSYLYAGYRYDSVIGIYHLTTRYYNQNIMRFISLDPIDGMNAYTYIGHVMSRIQSCCCRARGIKMSLGKLFRNLRMT